MSEWLMAFLRWLVAHLGADVTGMLFGLFALAAVPTLIFGPFILCFWAWRTYLFGKTHLLRGLYSGKAQQTLLSAAEHLGADGPEQVLWKGRIFSASSVFCEGGMFHCIEVDVDTTTSYDLQLRLLYPQLYNATFDWRCMKGQREPGDKLWRSLPPLEEECMPKALMGYAVEQYGTCLCFVKTGFPPSSAGITAAIHAIHHLVETLEMRREELLFSAFSRHFATGGAQGRDVIQIMTRFPDLENETSLVLERCLAAHVLSCPKMKHALVERCVGLPGLLVDGNSEERYAAGLAMVQALQDELEDVFAYRHSELLSGLCGEDRDEAFQLYCGAWQDASSAMSLRQRQVATQLLVLWLKRVRERCHSGDATIVDIVLHCLRTTGLSRERALFDVLLSYLHIPCASSAERALLLRVIELLEELGSSHLLSRLEQYKATAPTPFHAGMIGRLSMRLQRGPVGAGGLSLVPGDDDEQGGGLSLASDVETGELSLVPGVRDVS